MNLQRTKRSAVETVRFYRYATVYICVALTVIAAILIYDKLLK